MGRKPRATHPIECKACHKMIGVGEIIINHHVTYFPEQVVQVHASCHSYIHIHKTKYQDLRPDARQTLRWYKKHNGNYVYKTELWPWQFEQFWRLIDKQLSF